MVQLSPRTALSLGGRINLVEYEYETFDGARITKARIVPRGVQVEVK